jgi:hypothetical protein
MSGIRRFVAVGISANDASYIGFSSNGESWTVVSETNGLFSGGYGHAIASDGNGTFVAVGNSDNDASSIGYSLNGVETWSVASVTNGLFRGSSGNAVAYGDGRFVAMGNSDNDASSIGFSTNNGDTWQVADNTNGLFQGGEGGGIAYGYNNSGIGVFVAVGDSLDDLSNIGYSTNGGQSWQVASVTNGLFKGGEGEGRGIAYGHTPDGTGIFVAVGNGSDVSNIGYSTTGGQTWQVATNTGGLFENGSGGGVTFGYDQNGNGVFVAVGLDFDGYYPSIGYSNNGNDWTVVPNEDLNGLFGGGAYNSSLGQGIAYGDGVFVAVGLSPFDNNNVGFSTNGGETWSVATRNGLFENGDDFENLGIGASVAFSHTLPPTPPISNICFPAGTLIKTDQGIFPIEKLHLNINKYTIDKQPIQHITKTVTQDPYLICFEKNALGPNMPSEKTTITKEHKILFEGNYKSAEKFLKQSNKVKKVKYNGELLYNVLLENHGSMQVNNLICETLHPDNLIAKLYNNYKAAERPELVCQLNASLLQRDATKYKAVERKISHKY